MMDADAQLIEYSPGPSHSDESSDSEESSGSDTPSNQPTQLLYTQLLDSYDRYGEDMDDTGRTQQLDPMDMATQLIEDDAFDDFRGPKGMADDCTMIIPSEDEASKDTQLVNADDDDSGTSSGKDDEVDSGLSPYGAAFKEQSSHWLAEMTGKRRAENGSPFTYGEGSAGLGHDVYGNPNSGRAESDRKHLKSGNSGAGVGNSCEMQSRGIPHFLKDPDLSKPTFGSHKTVGSWHEVVERRNRCNEDQRVWESTMGGIQLVDSDATTEEEREEEEDNERHLNTSSTYPGEANSSQNVSGRLSAHSSGNFCQQDLNKSPEPEAEPVTLLVDDDWGGDLGIIGRIDEGGSNVGILDRHEETCSPKSAPNVSRSSEGVQAAERRSLSKVHSNSRTSGSIRTASLRASALRASSCSSSARYRHTPLGSQNEEVQNLQREATDTPTCDAPWKTAKSADFVTPKSRLSIQKGDLSSAASVASVWSDSEKAGGYPTSAEGVVLPENVKDQAAGESSAEKYGRSGASASGLDGSKTGDKNLKSARKLFSGNEVDQDDEFSQVKEDMVHKSPSPADEDGETREKVESMPPNIIDSQADKRLERRSSFGSGIFSQGSELSYLNFQSPGEDSQARALNMVDKLVWLNATGLSQEPQVEEEKASARGTSNTKSALQSRVHVAEAKAGLNDPLGVFDWVDSQHDDAGIFFGSKGTNALKGKPSAAAGHPKQIGFGTRKASVLDACGLRNKKIEKAPEKPLRPVVNTEKPKGLLSMSAMNSKEKRSEQHMKLGKDSTSAGLTHNLSEPERVQTAPSLEAHQQTIANEGLHDGRPVEQPVKNHDIQRSSSKSISDKQTDESLTKSRGKGGSNLPTSLPHSPTKLVLKGKSPVTSPRGSRSEGLQEAAVSSKNEKTETKLGEFVPKFTLPRREDEANQQSDSRRTASADMPCPNSSSLPNPMEEDGSDRGMPTADLWDVPAPCSPRTPGDRNDQAFTGAVLQPQHPESAVRENNSGEARLEPENQQGKSFEPLVEFNHIQEIDSTDCDVDGSVGAPGSVSSAFLSPEKGAEENAEVASFREINMGPDTLGAVEAMEMLSSDFLAANGEGASRDKETSNVAGSDDDRTAGLISETNDGVEGRHIITRRSRTQGRQSARADVTGPLQGYQHSKMRERNRRSEITDPSSAKTNMFKDRARNRRVSWAGPLEQEPRTVEVRRGRSARHQQNASTEEEDTNNSRPSSDQDVEDAKDNANGDRKRKPEGLDIGASNDSDLDRIKKRFNMSDAAVARLLGTDEDEDPEISLSPGVKTRSLSHMQPEAEEDEPPDAPKMRKVGKGLRSTRSRGDDGSINGRRKRACTTLSDQEKHCGEERTGSPCDAAEINAEPTACVEMHPSDNEALPGRRRMRSIADVSSPSVKKTALGRPPQGTALSRGRGRRPFRAPAEQNEAEHSDAEEVHVLPFPIPPPFPSVNARLRGKGGPRSARKRKELDPLTVDVDTRSPTSSKEASTTSSREASKRRKGEVVTACVLFSHGLHEDVGKQQRKIVAKLGGKVTSCAAECTHFVAEKFVRTGNMLEAMAAGKPVVTTAWLDNCLQAKCFVAEQPYILRDTKKEVEMGFCMVSTLNEAQQRPLLQGIRVYITRGTSPGPDALARIVKAAGGQIVDEYFGPAPDGERKSDFCLVLSSEEDVELCIPFLEQGAKVFTPELLLSGVMCHNLDFSNDQLFQNFINKRRRASLSRRTPL